MVIANESFLNIFLIQKLHVLLNLLAVLIFPLTVCVHSVKVVLIRWSKWTFKPLMEKIVPWKVLHPRMVLHILRSIKAKSVKRLSLDKSVDEVSSLNTPACWNFVSLDLYLFGKDVLPDLSSVPTSVWSSPEHTLISDDTHCKVVNSHSMWLLAHHLRSHVAWCSGSVL